MVKWFKVVIYYLKKKLYIYDKILSYNTASLVEW